ncbi:MAG: MFS transporter [Alphaproteobacteria bacterium]|jgi:PAT family beta-lactamase induction signal transducer AmpG|nr:MFS transporter [Alphaproteobacteria bacterium]MBO6626884.1 MFS transporter [Alphaproteobacteria bacterium]MDF1627651.1 MFS transporter [Parvibaculaceae bacterium]
MNTQLLNRARLLRAFRVYGDRQVLIILLLGFSSGLPLALTGSTLSIWMRDEGVDLGTIGLFSLVGLPYVLKFLWAPLIDAARLPGLSRWLGRRRAWLVLTQVLLLCAILGMGLVDPVRAPGVMAFAAVLVAFLSASQDIVIDAFRVETLGEDQYAAGMANYVAAYRVALLVAGAGAVGATGLFEALGFPPAELWAYAYALMASLMGIGLLASFFAREPAESRQVENAQAALDYVARFRQAVVDPFLDFAAKPGWIWILAFVIFFKFGDAFAGAMVGPFALDIGFDKETYAYIANLVGLMTVIAGGFVGGLLGRLVPLKAALWITGILQLVSNLVFCWLAWVGPDATALAVSVAVESFAGGMGTVIFVAYLSGLCSARTFTATQFALLSALAAVGRTILSASAGFVAIELGWVLFFVATSVAALPGLILLVWLSRTNRMDFVNPLKTVEK